MSVQEKFDVNLKNLYSLISQVQTQNSQDSRAAVPQGASVPEGIVSSFLSTRNSIPTAKVIYEDMCEIYALTNKITDTPDTTDIKRIFNIFLRYSQDDNLIASVLGLDALQASDPSNVDKARKIIIDSFKNQFRFSYNPDILLNLSNLGLSSLPENLFEHFIRLKIIDCSQNQLTSLPKLPAFLERLDCSGNRLTSLPSFPSSLYIVRCDDNQLTSLPLLPEVFTIGKNSVLSCKNNYLTPESAHLPSRLQLGPQREVNANQIVNVEKEQPCPEIKSNYVTQLLQIQTDLLTGKHENGLNTFVLLPKELQNKVFGLIYTVAKKEGYNTQHGDFGRVAFFAKEGEQFFVPENIRIRAIQKLLLEEMAKDFESGKGDLALFSTLPQDIKVKVYTEVYDIEAQSGKKINLWGFGEYAFHGSKGQNTTDVVRKDALLRVAQAI